jgi:hypothetical protein
VQQESAPPVKGFHPLLDAVPGTQVAELVLDSGEFVTIYPVKLAHILAVSNMDAMGAAIRMTQMCARFDGVMWDIEKILELGGTDFLRINAEINRTLNVPK